MHLFLAHTDPLFFSLNILKLHDIFTYSLCIYVFKNLNQFPNFSCTAILPDTVMILEVIVGGQLYRGDRFHSLVR